MLLPCSIGHFHDLKQLSIRQSATCKCNANQCSAWLVFVHHFVWHSDSLTFFWVKLKPDLNSSRSTPPAWRMRVGTSHKEADVQTRHGMGLRFGTVPCPIIQVLTDRSLKWGPPVKNMGQWGQPFGKFRPIISHCSTLCSDQIINYYSNFWDGPRCIN